MTKIQQAAQDYINEGWELVRIRKGEKAPSGRWGQAKPAATDFEDGDQIAGKCSDERVCLDADCDEVRLLLPEFIAHAHVEGRPSKPQSHWWVRCPGATTRRFKDVDGATLLEVLAKGAYAVLPPSLHPSGEHRAWCTPRPATWPQLENEGMFPLIAATALMARHWPRDGGRHDLAGPLAGLLLRCGVEPNFVPRLIRLAAQVAGDPELDDREKYARSSVERFTRGEPITGGPKVAELLGVKVKSRICSFLSASDFGLLDDLNKRWFLCDVGTETVVAEEIEEKDESRNWTRLAFRSFDKFRDKLIKYDDVVIGRKPNGEPMTQSAADYWLEHEEGLQYDRVIYAPEGSGIDVRPDDYNAWKGFTVVPAPGDWSPARAFIHDIICDGDAAMLDWLLDWCAALLQRPGEHADTALVLKGASGIGKNFFMEKVLAWCFDGRHATTVFNMNGVLGDFNDRLSGLVLLTMDEVSLTPAQSVALRSAITGDSLDINRKNIARASERSMLHLAILSNADVPVHLIEDDRRFAVFNVSAARQNDHKYFASLIDVLDQRGGRAAMLHELLARPYDRNRLRLAPVSAAKRDLKAGSLTPQHSALRHWLMREEHRGSLEVLREELFQQLRAPKYQPSDFGWSDDALGSLVKRIWPHLPRNTKRRVSGIEKRTYQFGLVSDARQQFDDALGIVTDWPTSKMDDLIELAKQTTASEWRKLGNVEHTAWQLAYLASVILKTVRVDTSTLDAIVDEGLGFIPASPPPPF